MRAEILVALAALVPLQASAEIFRCRDASGQIYYTLSRPASCYPRSMPGAQVVKATTGATATAATFPRIDVATQASRDVTRRGILEAELAEEMRLQAAARDADTASHHARNIEALRKELSYSR